MSEALERVIAEQQKEIDHLRERLDSSYRTLNKNHADYVALKDAAFGAMDWPDDTRYRMALRDALRGQNWCLTCRECPCECDE